MNLPSSVIQKLDTCSGLDSWTARCSTGMTMSNTAVTANTAVHTRSGNKRVTGNLRAVRCGASLLGSGRALRSCFRTPTLQGKQTLWPLLNEENDQHQHCDLRQHGAGPRLEEFGDRAKAEGRDDGARQLPDAPQHHDHEAVDDVA